MDVIPLALRPKQTVRFHRLLFAIAALSLYQARSFAREHTIDYESNTTSCEVILDESTARLVEHRRAREDSHAGDACETISIETRAPIAPGSLIQPLPRARVIDELALRVWVRSNRDSARLFVRVIFPNQPNPATGTPLSVLVPGDSYTTVDRWQELTCTEIETRLKRLLPQLRKKLQTETGTNHAIDTNGSYVDVAVIEFQAGRGTTQIALDDLRFGPIVTARPTANIQSVDYRDAGGKPEAEFHLGRLFVGGRPFFPLILPYHGETPADLAQSRFNVAWVPDYRDAPLLESLKAAGLRSMAIPPRPAATASGAIDSSAGHLAPFGPETNSVMLWYLGTKIRPDVRRQLLNWEEQIRDADRTMRRPIMGDVLGQEREYSRHLSMIGVSRAPLQTTLGLHQYREFLWARRRLAKQGTFFWTWIHTEPDATLQLARERAGQSPLMIEPEQLWLEAYAALAAGAHGLGYWSQTTFDGDAPGAAERRLAIAQVNMQIELLEPWLATGAVQTHVKFSGTLPAQRTINPNPVAGGRDPKEAAKREALLSESKTQSKQNQTLSRELEASILRTDYGTLVLPVWYGEDAQFVPRAMSANDVKIVVPGVGDTAGAWEISTTEISRIVDSTRVAGGRQIALRKFDMTSAILFTDDMRLVERLQSKMLELREASARVAVELARTKLERVNATALTLQAIRPQPDAPQILTRSREMLRRADVFLADGRFHDARLAAGDCLQLQRILQSRYWDDAVQKMYSPVSSPHTLCFATLPEHWEMVSKFRMARETGTKNILRSGDFEDFDTMVTEGWRHERADVDGIQATAEVSPQAHEGKYSLRLVAVPRKDAEPAAVLPEAPVTVISPGMTVYRGQMLYISGWVKVTAPITGSFDGATFTDSLSGPSLALRWRKPVDWHEFHLVREVHETTDLTLTLSLTGLGEVYFDDVKVVPLDTGNSSPGK
ncbi:MAG: hypothetical protein NT069_20045, partial [Planctomycetota bacterium]|nr:hypothetical protein [Planctomycetota bacterium]